MKRMILFFCCITWFKCREAVPIVPSISTIYIQPAYDDIQLRIQEDSLHFPLSENTYNEIKSFNYFTSNGEAFISFYDRRSESIVIYDFLSQRRIKKIHLKKCFKDEKLFKVSVYVKNFDSIFIGNQRRLSLMDSSGIIKKSIEFFKGNEAMAVFENTVPIALKNDVVYMGVRPYMDETSFSDIHKWRLLYAFDFKNETRELFYPLPAIYHKNLYGDRFFDYSYCYNERGNFIFSFPADTCIYETNLTDYHIAYYAKSSFQADIIMPVTKGELENDEEAHKQYFIRDSYGPIYYDPYKKRYLRLVNHKMSVADYEAKTNKRKQSLIIFNERFKIIGESEISDDFSFSSVFFTGDGSIYARVNSRDEYTLHFVHLQYSEGPGDSSEAIDGHLSIH